MEIAAMKFKNKTKQNKTNKQKKPDPWKEYYNNARQHIEK